MGTKRFLSIDDCGRHGAAVRVTCRRCGRFRDFEPFTLRMLFHPKPPNWLFDTVGERMVCHRCGAKGAIVQPAGWRGDR